MTNKLFNYVYEITYSNNKKYIGVRSCNCPIEEDSYMGSAWHVPEEIKSSGVKKVLSTHQTREIAMEEEIRLHKLFDVKNNPDYYNQCNASSTKFQVSDEAHRRSAITRTGRTAATHEYISKQVQARSKYIGNNRTEAQKAAYTEERMQIRIRKYHETLQETLKDPIRAAEIHAARVKGGKSCAGIKNPAKGRNGIEHPRVEPWYYVMPDKSKTEVFDSIRNYVNKNKTLFPVSSATIMRYIREDKVPERLSKLGWQFGKLNEQRLTSSVE